VQAHVFVSERVEAHALGRHVGPREAAARTTADVENPPVAIVVLAEPEEVDEKPAVKGDPAIQRALGAALAPVGQLAAVLAPLARSQAETEAP